jgi:hypothetical protein
MPHVIRLRGPWKCADRTFDWDTQLQDALAGGTRTCLSRQFGMPTGLTASDEVRLVIEGLTASEVRLNGTALTGAFDVTNLLQARNSLEIECSAAGSASQVRIEIHP